MNAKTTIRKVLFITLWLCISGGMLTLLLAAISKRNKGLCSEYNISLKGARNNFFIDKKDVEELLMKAMRGDITGQPVASFNLHELEQMLEHNTWIDEAELYFDNRDVLHITVTEKEPVARVFTTTGTSFYLDSLGRKMPLSDKLSARVPVFTGFPEKKKWTAADSVLLNEVRVTANYIINDPFWTSQVAQVDITPERNFEMVPVVGNHLVKLGNGEQMDKKFHRLMVFYKQVLSHTGFDKYKVIDVQYKGQVVVSRSTGNPKVDALQLKKNVEKLLRQSIEADNDTVIRALPPIIKLEVDSASAPDPGLKETVEIIKTPGSPNPVESFIPVKTVKKANPKDNKQNVRKKQPKAVMPRRVTE
ncbi:MAG: hypothetical protein H7Y01_15995 [Ferruginibacter sp.]|nr:hypothetical protein [Chitinophagaceae bacterium]